MQHTFRHLVYRVIFKPQQAKLQPPAFTVRLKFARFLHSEPRFKHIVNCARRYTYPNGHIWLKFERVKLIFKLPTQL